LVTTECAPFTFGKHPTVAARQVHQQGWIWERNVLAAEKGLVLGQK